jgi:uncharacterized RDD family membrane protein YckC
MLPESSRPQLSGIGTRFLALVIDGLMLAIPTVVGYAIVIGSLVRGSAEGLVFGALLWLGLDVAFLVWYCRRTARTGQWWGRVAVGDYLVRADTLQPPSAWGVFGREVARLVSALPMCLGYLWACWDPQRQTWHDKIANTVVVRSLPATAGSGTLTPPGPAQAAPPSVASAPAADVLPSPSPIDAEAGIPGARSRPVEAIEASTVLRPPARVGAAPVSAGGPAPGGAAPISVVPGVERPQFAPPDAPITPATPSSAAAAGWRLRGRDGRELELTGVVVIGRDPVAGPGERVQAAWAIDGDFLVSKTHLAVGRAADGTAWVEDRGSTNGTRLVRRGETIELVAGTRTPLEAGDVLRFGEQTVELAGP